MSDDVHRKPPPGAASRLLRALNEPQALHVDVTAQGNPARVVLRGKRIQVVQIQDCWRVDDEWWRIPLSRRYVQAVLENGKIMTLYHDLVEGRWYTQGA